MRLFLAILLLLPLVAHGDVIIQSNGYLAEVTTTPVVKSSQPVVLCIYHGTIRGKAIYSWLTQSQENFEFNYFTH